MNEESYPFESPSVDVRYRFTSVSKEKKVQKVVLFSLTDKDGVYNLALLDVLPNGGTSDITETNNRDMNTVLATVIQIVIDFFDKNPKCFVTIRGSDPRRHRLYHILINRELEAIQEQFKILGRVGEKFETFRRNQGYDLFVIYKHL